MKNYQDFISIMRSSTFFKSGLCLLIIIALTLPAFAQDAMDATDSICYTEETDSFFYHIERAGILRGQGNFEDALVHYDCAIEDAPENYLAYRSRAVVQTAIGNFMGALLDLELALQLNPDDPVAYNNRAHTLIRMGRNAEALVAVNRAILLNNEYANAYNNRGVIYSRIGDIQSAISDYETAIELEHQPPHFPYVNLGNLYRDEGDLNRARELYQEAVFREPFYADGFKLLGDVYLQMGDIEMAERSYLQYIAITNTASEDVLSYIQFAQLREASQRYLPTLLIVMIILYFIVDAILRWRRSRRATTTPIAEIASTMPASAPSKATPTSLKEPVTAYPQALSPAGEDALNQRPAWQALLLLPVLAFGAMLLRAFFGKRDINA